jgi:hypothetical protein
MSGLVNCGLIEYFCKRVTIKKLVRATEKIKKIYKIVKIAVIKKKINF